jgi:hypothetical protein
LAVFWENISLEIKIEEEINLREQHGVLDGQSFPSPHDAAFCAKIVGSAAAKRRAERRMLRRGMVLVRMR